MEREVMIAEENTQHHQRRHDIAAEDGPRLERVEQPRAEDHHGREDRDLEAAEEREDPEEQVSIALGDGEEAGNRQAEGDEGDPWTAVYLKTRPGVIVSAAGSRRPSKRTAPSKAGVRNGVPVIRSSTKNQTATAAAPARPTRIPSERTFCRFMAVSSEHCDPAPGATDLRGATASGAGDGPYLSCR